MSEPKRDPRIETGKKQATPPPSADTPAAGPHAKPELIDDEKTPGAGSLPDDKPTGDADAGVG